MLIVMIVLTILAIVLCEINYNEYNAVFYLSGIGAIILGIIDVVMAICIIVFFGNGIIAKPKIKMYEEENTKIEKQIDILVKNYMEYEGKTLKEFKSESSMTLVSLYPELKSDELVKEQIKTYTTNNNKIKELKENEIDLKIGKWLLYFGG